MMVRIFNVEHGQCSLIRTDCGKWILVDCGHNSTTGWRPSRYLPAIGISRLDALIITNADEDHASDLHNLVRKVEIAYLFTNPTTRGAALYGLKGQDIGPGIETLVQMTSSFGDAGSPLDLGTVRLRQFYNQYPTEFEDENNLSLVTFISDGILSICFPGDVENRGWLNLLKYEGFRDSLAETSVFMASHHGRESGCCDELYTLGGLSPDLTVISDGGLQYATQQTVNWYASRTEGLLFGDRTRRVLTTRFDRNIDFRSEGWDSYIVDLNVQI